MTTMAICPNGATRRRRSSARSMRSPDREGGLSELENQKARRGIGEHRGEIRRADDHATELIANPADISRHEWPRRRNARCAQAHGTRGSPDGSYAEQHRAPGVEVAFIGIEQERSEVEMVEHREPADDIEHAFQRILRGVHVELQLSRNSLLLI